MLAVRTLEQVAGYRLALRAKAKELYKQLRRRLVKLAPRPKRIEASLSSGSLTSLGASSDPGSVSLWGSRLWADHAGAQRLRMSEHAARHPWWLAVELGAIVLLWVDCKQQGVVQAHTAKVDSVFSRVNEAARGGGFSVSDTLGLRAVIELSCRTVTISEMANKGNSLAYRVVMLLLLTALQGQQQPRAAARLQALQVCGRRGLEPSPAPG